jgi:outer membrane protein
MYNFWSAQVGLQVTLFDFGRVYYGWRWARDNREAARAGTDAALLQVTFDARAAFYTALAAEEQVRVARESVATQQRHFDQMRGFFEVGTRTRVDVAQSQADLASAQLLLVRTVGALAAARALLAAALGLDRWREMTLVPPPEIVEGEAAPGAEQIADEAVARRPEPRQLDLQARGSIALGRSARAGYLPSLTLVAGPNFAGPSLDNLTTNLQVAVTLSYPIAGFNPVLVSGQVREAEASAAVFEEQARGARNNIRLEAAQAVVALETARQGLVTARQLVAAARERREQADARFTSGVGTVLELSDAEQAYVTAQGQLIQAEVDLGVARARVERALGR